MTCDTYGVDLEDPRENVATHGSGWKDTKRLFRSEVPRSRLKTETRDLTIYGPLNSRELETPVDIGF